jgi:ABC-type sugar transport system ATPase subunit
MNDSLQAPAPGTVLTARAVHKTYFIGQRKVEVLRGIDLLVERGEFLALRGASGTGKSTLLHLLGGLDLPDAGEIIFDSANLRSLSSAALSRLRNRRVGFIFQAYHLLPELTALENVALPARMARISPRTPTCAAVIYWNGSVWASGWSIGLPNPRLILAVTNRDRGKYGDSKSMPIQKAERTAKYPNHAKNPILSRGSRGSRFKKKFLRRGFG